MEIPKEVKEKMKRFKIKEGSDGPPMHSNKDVLVAATVSPDGGKIAFVVLKYRHPGLRGGPVIPYRRLMVLETATGKAIQQSDLENDGSTCPITFSPDGNLVTAGGRAVRVWDVNTGKEVHRFDGHRGLITSLAFSPDGKRLASASGDSTALVWDVSK